MKSGHRLLVLACFLCLAVPALATTRYVNLDNPAPVSPFTNWLAAATNIQDAIDAASPGDLILVTNGIYKTGSRTAIDDTPCRIVVNKPVTVRSVNGSGATAIEGYSIPGSFPWSLNSVRCAYLTNGAMLTGFTLTNGSVVATSYRNLGDPAAGLLRIQRRRLQLRYHQLRRLHWRRRPGRNLFPLSHYQLRGPHRCRRRLFGKPRLLRGGLEYV